MIKFSFNGASEFRKNLKALRTNAPTEVGRALYQATEIVATQCKKITPVDTGALRASIFVVGPIMTGKRTQTMIVAGGPAAPYAFFVHENLTAVHPVGQAKYIEQPVLESRTTIATYVAAFTDLNRAMTGTAAASAPADAAPARVPHLKPRFA